MNPYQGLICECCKANMYSKTVMCDGYTSCCGANTIDHDGKIHIIPNTEILGAEVIKPKSKGKRK